MKSFRRRHDSPETEPHQHVGDPARSGSVALATEVVKPKPSFSELLAKSGHETATAFIADLMKKAHSSRSDEDQTSLRQAFDAVPVHSRVGIFPADGVRSLPGIFIGRGHSDLAVGESGISAKKADPTRSVDAKIRYDSHVEITLGNDQLVFRSGSTEWRVELPYDSSGEPLFNLEVKLPESSQQ